MFAIFQNWGKQYKVQVGDIVTLEKIDQKEWAVIEIKQVLAVFDDKKAEIWAPFVSKTIKAKIVENWRWDKVTVFKMKSKKRYARKRGHRQYFSKIEITEIK